MSPLVMTLLILLIVFVALLSGKVGYGTVGGGAAEVLTKNAGRIERRYGKKVEIKYILDLREFPGDPLGDRVVHDFSVIENDPEISIVLEMMGGIHPACDFSAAALRAGKSVVTSNKAVVEHCGAELLSIAAENKVRYLYEASVGGGIPVLNPLIHCITGQNTVTEINGILNGTTNYILTRMREEGLDYDEVLADAQRLGYAEADPSADVDGFDACRKICILAAIASGKMIPMDKVRVRGIREITQEHIAKANEMGARIRLVARAVLPEDGCVCLSVEPYYVRRDNPLYGVDDVFNAVSVTGDSVGEVMFYGKGAGKLPTASAVVADVLDIVARGDSFAADENIMFTVAPEAYSDKLPEKYALSTEQTLGTPVFA